MGTKPVLKVGAVLWALLIGGTLVILAGSVLMPGAKRARIAPEDLEKLGNAVAGDATTTRAVEEAPQRERLFPGTKSMVLPTTLPHREILFSGSKSGPAFRPPFSEDEPTSQPSTKPTAP